MDIFESLIDFFGIETLSNVSTFPDLINFLVMLCVGVYIVAFFIRSLFLVIALPTMRW